MQTARRDYASIAARLADRADAPAGVDRTERMRHVVDVLWDALHPTGVSWVGFYFPDPAGAPANTGKPPVELILGPRRDEPACSPIGMHGACGECFLSGRPVVVRDVRERGANYVACDPRDMSEVVVPCIDETGACWAVLDLDSHDLGSFGQDDVAGLEEILSRVGLTHAAP